AAVMVRVSWVVVVRVRPAIYSLTGIYWLRTVLSVRAETFRALGEPSRLQIVEMLRSGPSSVGTIADTLSIRQPQVSKHLRVLTETGVVDVEPVSRQRIYRLREEPFEEITNWIDSFDRLWATRLDSLDTYLTRSNEDRPSPGGSTP
ncbi:MAG: ArsR/SmtB family transcription factor, partial [Acidimicrobiia bacterium]